MLPRRKRTYPEIPILTDLEAENIVTRKDGYDDALPLLPDEEEKNRVVRKKNKFS